MNFLDNDWYKFLTQQAIVKFYPDAWGEFSLINRSKIPISPLAIGSFLNTYPWCKPKVEDIAYLVSKGMNSWYGQYLLEGYKPENLRWEVKGTSRNVEEVRVSGSWSDLTLVEVPLLARIHEAYYIGYDSPPPRGQPLLKDITLTQ